MKRLFLAVLLFLLPVRAAAAQPGLLLGVDDDSLKWYAHTSSLLSIYRTLGLGAVRVTVDWPPDANERTELERVANAGRTIRVVLAVTGRADAPPLDASARSDYCAYTASILRRYPWIRDVAIWTEPNSRAFWRPQQGAAAAYEALLATCWDAVHAAQPAANVIASTAPHARPGDWYAAVGKAYRSSGRSAPIFDTIGHNAYPDTSVEPPGARHAHGSIDEGDLARLVRVLRKAFGSVPPIWYLEDGFQTAGSPPLYAGVETDRSPVSEAVQASRLVAAVHLAYCQHGVTAFFNFELRDDASLAGWQSGLLRPDWSPKPAFTAYARALAAAGSNEIDCGMP